MEATTIKRASLTNEESQKAFQRISKDLLAHDPERGTNHWGGAAVPAMLLGADRIVDFLRVLESITGFLPARRQSYLVGYKSGKRGAELVAGLDSGKLPEQGPWLRLAAAAPTLSGAGWGRCSIEYDEVSRAVRWEFAQGTALAIGALLEGVRKDPSCPFVAGFAAGWTNQVLESEFEFKEVECVGSGGSRCVFESGEFIRFRRAEVPTDE